MYKMSLIKSEFIEYDIDEMETSMQSLIERADRFINSLTNRSSNSNSSSSYDEINASSSRYSMNANYAEPEAEAEPETVSGFISNDSASSSASRDDGNGSSGSDTTILCYTDEQMPEPMNPAPAVVNNSFGQDVIIIGTPTTEPRRRRRARRIVTMPNTDTSVIDLSNYPEERNTTPVSIVVISSDEENEEAAPVTSTRIQPSGPGNCSTFTINSVGVSVTTSTPLSVHVLSNPCRNRRPQNASHNIVEDVGMRQLIHTAPVPQSSPPPPTQTLQQTNSGGTHTAIQGNPRSMSIICPICYEQLGNTRAISTSCGHVFCDQCIKKSLRTAKKCPLCNKSLSKANQMHPVYFATQ
uniref:RING-type domain-containing protein n=1 Tax=Anopheles minimus TaxID=112268 RepID=A0A903Z026_9DIPT